MSSPCRSAPMPRRWNRWRSADRPAANNLFVPLRASYLDWVEADIILTASAAKRVAWIAERQSKPAILRLAIDGGGCAGFTYKFELADTAEADDTIAETAGVKLV